MIRFQIRTQKNFDQRFSDECTVAAFLDEQNGEVQLFRDGNTFFKWRARIFSEE